MKSIDTIKNKYIRRTILLLFQPFLFIALLVAGIFDAFQELKPYFKTSWKGQNDDR